MEEIKGNIRQWQENYTSCAIRMWSGGKSGLKITQFKLNFQTVKSFFSTGSRVLSFLPCTHFDTLEFIFILLFYSIPSSYV